MILAALFLLACCWDMQVQAFSSLKFASRISHKCNTKLPMKFNWFRGSVDKTVTLSDDKKVGDDMQNSLLPNSALISLVETNQLEQNRTMHDNSTSLFKTKINKCHISDKFDLAYRALEAYKAIYGNLLVKQSFIVPENDDRFPKDTWGKKLGVTVLMIRRLQTFTEYRLQLTELGFDYSPQKPSYGFNILYAALKAYKSIFGDVLVPQNFTVPENDDRYPKDTWKMRLGSVVNNIRCLGIYAEHKHKLEELGFVYSSQKKAFGFDLVCAVLEVYKSIYGDMRVPYKFIVPENDDRYPKDSRGMKLGYAVNNIRHIGVHKEHREKLLELGFDYSVRKLNAAGRKNKSLQ